MTVLTDLGEYLSVKNFRNLNPVNQEAVRIHVLDTVGASIVGAHTDDGNEALSFQASDQVINALTDSPLDDVATRCFLTRLSEVDDIHLPSGTTPGSIIVPTAIILSHHLKIKDPNRFASAVVAGYEAMTRLGSAVDGPNIVYRGLWTTYFTAPFGTAAVTARLLGLDGAQTAHALAIALTLLAGRMGKPGVKKTSRWLMAGHAARSGCFAALSAASGFTGDLDLFDGGWMENAHGVFMDKGKFSGASDTSCVVPEISIKPYFGAKQMMANFAAFDEILARGINPNDIDSIKISVPESYAKMIDHGVEIGNRLSSATSAPYQIALAAYNRDSLFDIARAEYIDTDEMKNLMGKVSVEIDTDLAKHLPNHWPGRIKVKAGDRIEDVTIIEAPGDPTNAFDLARVIEKFHQFSDRLIGAEAADSWISLAQDAVLSDQALASLQPKYLAFGK